MIPLRLNNVYLVVSKRLPGLPGELGTFLYFQSDVLPGINSSRLGKQAREVCTCNVSTTKMAYGSSLRTNQSSNARMYFKSAVVCSTDNTKMYSTTAGLHQSNQQGKESWVDLLYKDDDGSLQLLRRKLGVALTSKRSHEKGDLLPYLVAQDFIKFYKLLTGLKDKADFFHIVSDKLGVDSSALSSQLSKCEDAMKSSESLRYRYERSLVNNLTPCYEYLFNDISRLEHGVSFLVKMRGDLLQCSRASSPDFHTPSLHRFDVSLKEHLAKWFASGFLDLQEISWEKTPAGLLEKIMTYEAVHKIGGWDDLKLRAGIGRRIFSFCHRLMPGEPLVILHVLLSQEIPSNIHCVLSINHTSINDRDVTTATFYSISSTQRGLDGIGLGNLLIKRVVEELQKGFCNMSQFVSLSPIPGFRKWLDSELDSAENTGEIPTHLQGIYNSDPLESILQMKRYLSTPDWYKNTEFYVELQEPLTRMCARYLYHVKRRGFASNPVAHFHLRNGACIWRLNWLGHSDDVGMKRSYGLMVNYKYELDQLLENNDNYVQSGKVAVSQLVHKYLE